jgi:hypothetical protein
MPNYGAGNVARQWLILRAFFLLIVCASASAQIDPFKRKLVQLGYNHPMEGLGPIAAYGFYYQNMPSFLDNTNLTLRVAAAPIYVDSELGISSLLGPNTDLGIGVSGGGWGDSYSEIRGGRFLRQESYDGHGGEGAISIYHLFNPDYFIPLSGVARVAARARFFDENSDTAAGFKAPHDYQSLYFRTGLRFGGKEPTRTTPQAMELSVWYEGHFRTDSEPYGFAGDRDLKPHTHLFWSRALLKYTFEESQQYVDISLTAGVALEADRLSAYRIGGVLPFVSEFPLSIPGYYYQEITAEKFALLAAEYSFPLEPRKNWLGTVMAATAAVEYLDGLSQPRHWHSGVGGGITYASPRRSWFVTAMYGYGIDAIRNGERGAHQVGMLFQYDFVARKEGPPRPYNPSVSPYRSRGAERIFR